MPTTTIPMTKEKRSILIKIGIYVALVLTTYLFSEYVSGTLEDYEKKHKFIKNDITDLNKKLEGMNQKTLEFSEAIKTWEALPEEEKKLQGLRINDSKEILDKLAIKYKLSSLKTSFSKPEEISGNYTTDTTSLISSIISLNFNALSDEYVYSFIIDLTKSFPGYVQIKSLSINKPTQITKEILKKISIGEEVAILPVTMDFYWQDLKYKGSTTPQDATGGQQVK